jgi:hypothetical protein
MSATALFLVDGAGDSVPAWTVADAAAGLSSGKSILQDHLPAPAAGRLSKVKLHLICKTMFFWTVKTRISFAYIKEKRTGISDVRSEEELGNVFY